MSTASQAESLSRERPWPGLASYTEADHPYFFGREVEAEDLARRIRRERLTVLFGQSGLGKTSLLQAGLFPRLRANDLQPIYLRLDYTARARPLAEQVVAEITAVISREGLDAPLPEPDEGLWAYFHRRNLEWWSPRNRLLTPVLVFDQFEEIFTLGRDHAARSQTFLDELADLIENRAPDSPPPEGQDNSRVVGKILLSFREDFLPDFESLKGRIHSLFLNRLRLERLSGAAAKAVLEASGGHLLAPGLAEDIVRFVAAEKKPRPLKELTVEPALLSVVCRELNERRIGRHADSIGADMLELGQHEILRDLVGRALADQPAALVEQLEEHLLTDGGHRAQYPLPDLIQRAGIGREAIQALVAQRILRVEPRGDVEWLELTHDLLAPVVRENRDRRRQAMEREKSRRKLRRLWAFAAAMLVLVVSMAALSWNMFLARQEASAALVEATKQKLEAQTQRASAERSRNRAVAAEMEANAQRETAERERSAAVKAQANTAAALNQALAAELSARQARDEARRRQSEAEYLAANGALDMAMLGHSKKYDTWERLVAGTLAASQAGDRVAIAHASDLHHEYFSKKGMETEAVTISGFDDSDPQSSQILLQGRKPKYSLMELEAAGPAKYFMLDSLHDPARYFCGLATPQEFPIFKRFKGTPGFPWEMQCKLLEAIYLSGRGRQVEAETSLERALELGFLQINGNDQVHYVLYSGFYEYIGRAWAKKKTETAATGNGQDTSSSPSGGDNKKVERPPNWKERANLVRHVYILDTLIYNLRDRSKYITFDDKVKTDGSRLYPYLKQFLSERMGRRELMEAFGKMEHNPPSDMKSVLAALPGPLQRQAMAELRLPDGWEQYSGWYERKLLAQAGPAYVDGNFLREFLRLDWVAETMREWLKQEPDSSWAHYIEAHRLEINLTKEERARIAHEIDAHYLAAARGGHSTYMQLQSAAFVHYKTKRYSESILLWWASYHNNPSDFDSQVMDILTLIELGEAPNAAMRDQLDRIAVLAGELHARPRDVAEIAIARAIMALETGGRPPAADILSAAYRDSEQCAAKFFERRNWHEKMLKLLDKHRGWICKP